MRVLLLLRGAPGCGKTTWIEQNGLKRFAVSADDIRMLCSSPVMNVDGTYSVSVDNDKFVWDMLFKILETRMRHGDFTVIDATNSKTSEMNRYKKLCQEYRYRIFCVDFTSVPIEIAKERNAAREEIQRVPEEAIDKMYSRFETQSIPAGITVIQPDELDKVWMKPFDMNGYNKVHVIGDVHGCYTALKEYIDQNGGIKDDEFWIFTGDYIDRGIENVEVIKLLFEIYNKPNVGLLEGNHERWIWKWANDRRSDSREFELNTRRQLEDAGIDKKMTRKLYRKFAQCSWFTFAGKEFFISHGGISTIPDNLTLISSEQMIRGVGRYNEFEEVESHFLNSTSDNAMMIHGHRNTKALPIVVNDKVRNLEGMVEFGGCLRAVQLIKDGTENDVEVRNSVFNPRENRCVDDNINTVGDLVMAMRGDKNIFENRHGNISSFNFTPAAFHNKVWNSRTIKARGLYINLDSLTITARAYDKFFNIGEREDTMLDSLQRSFEFPAVAYVKENGFLGIVSYNKDTDDLFITTKSMPDGEFAGYLKDMVFQKMSPEALDKMKEISKRDNVSFVFECVDIENDPHIIEYDESKLVLLDIVYNDIHFRRKNFEEMCEIANELGVLHKELAFKFENWGDFYDWHNQVTKDGYEYNGRNIEGFVIESSNGNMVKLKLEYYKFWKFMRSITYEVLKKGYTTRTSALVTPLANRFYGWMKDVYQSFKAEDIRAEYPGPRDICSLRKQFYESMEVKL